MDEIKCICGCLYDRHFDDPARHGEKLGCVDCACKQYEEVPPPDLRTELEGSLILCARELLTFMGCAACLIPIPNTEPQLYIGIGSPGAITDLTEPLKKEPPNAK